MHCSFMLSNISPHCYYCSCQHQDAQTAIKYTPSLAELWEIKILCEKVGKLLWIVLLKLLSI